MLSNAVLAGAVAAAYVAALVLHLNPAIRLDDPAAWPLLGAVLLVYGVHLAVVFYAVIVARQVLSTEGVSPGWLSYRVLAWFCAAASTAAAALMWQNLWGFSAALDPDATRHFFVAAVTMTTCAAACVVLGVFRLWADRPGRLAAVAFGLVMLASIALPLAARGVGDSSRLGARRLRDIAGRCARYRRPPRRAARGGRGVARFHLAGCRRREAPELRAPARCRRLDAPGHAAADAARPGVDGGGDRQAALAKRRAFGGHVSRRRRRRRGGPSARLLLRARPGVVRPADRDASDLCRAPGPAVWTILGRAGLPSTIVRWPLTWPAQPLPGTLISDEFHRASEIALALDEPGLTYPTELASRLRASATHR